MTDTVKEKAQPVVYTDEHPEYPKTLYNHEKRKAAAANDKEHEENMAKEGYVKEPLPPEDPESLTDEEVADLQKLLSKAAKALAKLGKLSSEKHDADPKTPERQTTRVEAPPEKRR